MAMITIFYGEMGLDIQNENNLVENNSMIQLP